VAMPSRFGPRHWGQSSGARFETPAGRDSSTEATKAPDRIRKLLIMIMTAPALWTQARAFQLYCSGLLRTPVNWTLKKWIHP
jgi:hypothetical protein